MIGQRFGRLCVIAVSRVERCGKYVTCKCDCGAEKVIFSGSLKQGKTKSCGCLNSEAASERWKTHGMTRSRTHTIWCSIKVRCLKKNSPAYKDYGGRGIELCKEWSESFEAFLHDMGECPKGMSIDRINNEKGYFKENCRWASKKEQANNRRSNIAATLNGETKTLMQWAEQLGCSYDALRYRLNKHDGDLEKAIKALKPNQTATAV